MARLRWFKHPACGLEDNASELPDFLESNNFLKCLDFIFLYFFLFWLFLLILELFSHTDSHTVISPTPDHQDHRNIGWSPQAWRYPLPIPLWSLGAIFNDGIFRIVSFFEYITSSAIARPSEWIAWLTVRYNYWGYYFQRYAIVPIQIL